MPSHLIAARKQDPSLSALGTTTVFVPDLVYPGPRNDLIHVLGLPVLEPDANGDFLPDPLEDPLAFDATHTFAVVWRVSSMLRRAFGRLDGATPFVWQWGDSPIEVHPHYSQRTGAWYRRMSNRLEFNHFISGHEMIYTCRSFDMVAHETAHAVLDAVKPGWYPGSSTLKQTKAIHESFADIVSVFALLDQPAVCADIVIASRGDLHARTFLPLFAEEYGAARRPLQGYMRNADNDLRLDQVDHSRPYDLSKVMTGAIYDIIADAFDASTQDPHVNHVGMLNRVGEAALLRLVRAIVAAPQMDATFSDIAQAMIDTETEPNWRQIIVNQFRRRGITVAPPGGTPQPHLSEKEVECGEFCGANHS